MTDSTVAETEARSKAREQAVLFSTEPPEAMTRRQRFLRACHGRPVDCPPVWMMRQAGRVLPEYRALKEKYTFLELVQTPELAAEVTLQPIRRFDFDAAILFCDILVIPEALGQGYRFRETGGIEMDFELKTAQDVARLDGSRIAERLDYVPRALRLLKEQLGGRTALLGFAGSPWTLANFMLEGGSSKEQTRALELFHTEPGLFASLCEKLTRAVTEYLRMQINAGVDAVQIFDSHGGLLPAHEFEAASGRWIREIIRGLGSQVPVIVFSKGTHGNWDTLVATGAQVIGVDHQVRLSEVRRHIPPLTALQGNLDPALLVQETPTSISAKTEDLLREMAGRDGYIFNLGHGVPPAAKLENIEAVLATVRRTV